MGDLPAMATRQLVLVRHAKAAAGSGDIERPLTKRGHRDSAALGRWLVEQGIRPDRVSVSSGVRAQQTWSSAAAEMESIAEPVIDDRIYDNDVDELVEIARETPDEIGTLVLVGHNPSFEQFAHDLDDGDGDEAARRELSAGYPTCGVAVFGTEGSWRELRRARLISFAVPRG